MGIECYGDADFDGLRFWKSSQSHQPDLSLPIHSLSCWLSHHFGTKQRTSRCLWSRRKHFSVINALRKRHRPSRYTTTISHQNFACDFAHGKPISAHLLPSWLILSCGAWLLITLRIMVLNITVKRSPKTELHWSREDRYSRRWPTNRSYVNERSPYA